MIESSQFGGFLAAFAITAACTLAALQLLQGNRLSWMAIMGAVVIVSFACFAAAIANPGENIVWRVLRMAFAGSRLDMALLGAATSTGAIAALACGATGSSAWATRTAWLLFVASVAAFSSLSMKDALGRLLPESRESRFAGSNPTSRIGRYRVEKVASLSILPTAIALGSEGTVYVAGYGGMAYQNGLVLALRPEATGSTYREERVADYLNRPHGLAYRDGDLYVSRAGQYTRAVKGKVVQVDTGAVTRLRDLDGDGQFDRYDDLIVGLPGAQQPDGMHQNNGLAFDSEGRMFITVGAPADHAPAAHEYAGSIVVWDPTTEQHKVFARGLRNPFGIAVDKRDRLFCTDNDPSNSNSGDPLYYVTPEAHFGHPFVAVSDEESILGVEPPVLRLRSAQGMTYNNATNCLYVACYGSNAICEVPLNSFEHKGQMRVDHVADIPHPIAVAAATDGSIFAVSHDDRGLYRISRVEAAR